MIDLDLTTCLEVRFLLSLLAEPIDLVIDLSLDSDEQLRQSELDANSLTYFIFF